MKRSAKAVWTGDFKQGKGAISTESGALKQIPYSFTTRFESTPGTNPEELIGAAHAGCFSMALSAFLNKEGFKEITTDAQVSLDQIDGNWTITAIHLNLAASVVDINPEKFAEIAQNAKANCPVSRVLNAKITLDAKLVS
jgi:lipoyl-dependent peroxiredoxin